jgi:hypothetical protein
LFGQSHPVFILRIYRLQYETAGFRLRTIPLTAPAISDEMVIFPRRRFLHSDLCGLSLRESITAERG